jgi:AraC-like DNA-binding protein
MFICILSIHFYMNGLMVDFPHWLLIYPLTSNMGLPILFMIVWYNVQNKKLSVYHLLHLVPFIIFFINFKEIYFASTDQKRLLVSEMDLFGYNYIWQKGSFLSPIWVDLLRIVPFFFYVLGIGYLIFKKGSSQRLSDSLYKFFKVVFYFLAANLIPIIISLFEPDFFVNNLLLIQYLALITTSLVFVSFFFMPNLLYGKEVEQNNIKTLVSQFFESISSEEIVSRESQLMNRIEAYLDGSCPFLNSEFSLKTLEKELNISGRYISNAIKKNRNCSFSEYIHQKRMQYFFSNYMNNGEYVGKSIDEIAFDLGYKSINTFYYQFKLATGLTPGEYFMKNKYAALSNLKSST